MQSNNYINQENIIEKNNNEKNNNEQYKNVKKERKIKKIYSDLIILDVHISCDIFYMYSYKIPLDRSEYNVNNENKNELFIKLSNYICNYVTEELYNHLYRCNDTEMINILKEISPKFHIHSLTIDDILYPNKSTNNHVNSDGRIFICTHC